jgi:hypothetical protein
VGGKKQLAAGGEILKGSSVFGNIAGRRIRLLFNMSENKTNIAGQKTRLL